MGDCIFCKLANGEIPTDMVYEDDKIAVFRDAAPQAPVHMLMVPKAHIESLDDLNDEHADLMGHMMLKIKEVAAKEGLENGYRCVINTGEDGQQTVQHLHIHLIGYFIDRRPVGIDDRDGVSLRTQLCSQRGTDLSQADDNDIHMRFSCAEKRGASSRPWLVTISGRF